MSNVFDEYLITRTIATHLNVITILNESLHFIYIIFGNLAKIKANEVREHLIYVKRNFSISCYHSW